MVDVKDPFRTEERHFKHFSGLLLVLYRMLHAFYIYLFTLLSTG